MSSELVLGIWDGHDAGAALLRGDEIVFAVNEERLSRRKLDVGFPAASIAACLEHAGIEPGEVRWIGASTADPAKTLTRLFPSLKEDYYLLRRRKKDPRRLDGLRKAFKYRFTELEPNLLSSALSRLHLSRRLEAAGFSRFTLHLVDHHTAHAQTAARCSPFDECAVLTLDGVGDGLSGSIWHFRNGAMRCIHRLPARTSLGIFFEHATNLLHMRELEDEGKVMALANYAFPIEDSENPLIALLYTRGPELISAFRSNALYREMRKILWRYPPEQFAWMAQRALEKNVLSLAREALALTGSTRIALSGGVFSNIKANMKIAQMEEVEGMFVFPHMGDGGLALGAAIDTNARELAAPGTRLPHLYLGPGFSPRELAAAAEKSGLPFRHVPSPAQTAAELILGGDIVLWFQGRMELGPRALGNRSILARPDDRSLKDRLNLALKKRVWYQPFCPSMLIEDAPSLLYTNGTDIGCNRFMTTALRVREEYLGLMQGVVNIDGTCRPHMVGDEAPLYRELLLAIKERLGKGVLLNTSFNIHGEPIVSTPAQAIEMLRRTGLRHLFLGDFLVENDAPKDL